MVFSGRFWLNHQAPHDFEGFTLPQLAQGLGLRKSWRRERDSNPRCPLGQSGFQDRLFQPLTHPSAWLRGKCHLYKVSSKSNRSKIVSFRDRFALLDRRLLSIQRIRLAAVSPASWELAKATQDQASSGYLLQKQVLPHCLWEGVKLVSKPTPARQ